ncbi:MAG: ferredoxin [Candidatus Shapirobacteria bacterium]|nr:ferredoxin [Candidatus Shapirobacteria bacterium]
MKYQKIIFPTILVSSSFLVFLSIKSQISKTSNQSFKFNNQNSSSLNQQDEINSNLIYQKLSVISNRCRGCGKCVHLDPQHFEMSNQTAVVTSSNNLNSSNLAMAINNCPAQAIVLE